jgi:hypothetical protein
MSPEYKECGNHGVCDFKSGKCVCQHGFHGVACHDTTDAEDQFAAVHDGPFFTGTVIRGLAVRKPSSDFNLLELGYTTDITESNISVTTIAGDGSFVHRGDSEFYGEFQVHKTLTDRYKSTSLFSLSFTRPINEVVDPIGGNEDVTMVPFSFSWFLIYTIDRQSCTFPI